MQVFNTEGEFLLKFGSNGEGNGQFNAPTGVAVDVNGNIIVADWGNSRIQVSSKHLASTSRSRITTPCCIFFGFLIQACVFKVNQLYAHLADIMPKTANETDDGASSVCIPGVRWQRLLPLLHQHLSRPAVRPAGTRSHLRRTCRGCGFWQPLLQNLPLPAVAALLPQRTNCTVYINSHMHSLVRRQVSTHPLTQFIFEPCCRRAICLTVPRVNERQQTESSVV